jgi:hypothetical protein
MNIIVLFLAVLVSAVFVLSKCFFLARTRLGVALMLANVLYETAFKRLGCKKWHLDAVALPSVFLLWLVGVGPLTAGILVTVMGLVWGRAMVVDMQWRSGAFARQHTRYSGRVPLPVPRLLVVLRGPILERGQVYQLGAWPAGLEQNFQVLVSNPSVIVPQLPLRVAITSQHSSFIVEGSICKDMVCPDPGGLQMVSFKLRAPSEQCSAEAEVVVSHGDFRFKRILRLQSVVERSKAKPVTASITRWKYGARAAFAWRGDHDLYDPSTFQSVAGLRNSLGLARRFQLPTTLFLSGRLSLVEAEHRQFCQHFGWDRRSADIPGFIEFLRRDINIAVEQEWPSLPEKSFALELGNHMYLHYGTHAAAAPGNHWKSHARICEGQYDWDASSDKNSFSEQRDNALKNAALIRSLLGVEMATYAIPSDVYDAETARAVEAAGLEFGSDTNASKWINVFQLPAPHHPTGCSSLVELTRKYPRDPDDANQVAVLNYWAHAARRTGRAFILLCHHHMARYEGVTCYHLMEKLLWDVLADGEGDFYPATMGAIGWYWKRVLSPKHRCVDLTIDADKVRITNRGSVDLAGIPVEVCFACGSKFLWLAEVPAGKTACLSLVDGLLGRS